MNGLTQASSECRSRSSLADFSGINGKPAGLFLSGTTHSTFVDVNEEGIKPQPRVFALPQAAVRKGKPVVFRADHPFLFLIRDARSGCILFIGRVRESPQDEAATDTPPVDRTATEAQCGRSPRRGIPCRSRAAGADRLLPSCLSQWYDDLAPIVSRPLRP